MTKILIFLISLLIPSAKPCLSAWTAKLPADLPRCIQSLPALEPKLKFANRFLRKPALTDTINLIDQTRPLLPYLDYFLGKDKPVTYLLLLQNNYELRANGGFFGSYAKIILSNKRLDSLNPGVLEFSPEISFQDIYVPDGALVGHVEPPSPIQTAFKQGWFKLRDSDWEPDFPTAATSIRWFFEKGGEVNPDLLVTLNLATIEEMIAVLGDIHVPEYDLTLTHDNLYSLLQNQSEIQAFQGSTQKKDVLTAAGRAVIKKLSSLSAKGGSASGGKFDKLVQLAQILLDQLNHGNLLVNSTNPEVQKVILAKDWAGQLKNEQCGLSNCLTDTVLLVETNLGANKANCCVERKTVHTITRGETEISHLVSLTLTNSSPLENPSPPRFYGGNYISYLRFYLPENATNIRLTAQPTLPKTLTQYPAPFDGIKQKSFDQKDNYGLRELGFFHLTAAGTSSHLQLSYNLPLDGNPGTYQLNLLKQHGLVASPQEINLLGKSYSTDLSSDYSVSQSL